MVSAKPATTITAITSVTPAEARVVSGGGHGASGSLTITLSIH
jgi:hypothetical protein